MLLELLSLLLAQGSHGHLSADHESAGHLYVAAIFSSGMVLQEAPAAARIFGTYSGSKPVISYTLLCDAGLLWGGQAVTEADSPHWHLVLPPVPSRSNCTVSVTNGKEEVLLREVLFGDVWFCAGQSNMGWVLGGTENHTEEMEAARDYTNIRFYRTDPLAASQPQYDIQEARNGWLGWNSPVSEWPEGTEWEGGHWPSPLGDMSAICFLYARELSDHLGNKPLGLIASSWAGTRIEAWSPPEALETCGIGEFTDDKKPQNSNSYLYNALVAPFQGMVIKGAVWYQGESSTSWNPEYYICTFPAMVAAWRQAWSLRSGTAGDFPVGVVQLGSWRNPPEEARDQGALFPLIRWHQTLDYGYLPNPEEPNMFLALALDTYREIDGEGSEHPNNKQLPAKRLGWAGLSVVYGLHQFPTQGPFPTKWTTVSSGEEAAVTVDYQKPFTYSPMENSGFFYCCSSESGSSCAGDELVPSTDWSLLPLARVSQTSQDQLLVTLPQCEGPASLAYLWAESPVTRVEGLPIYSEGRWPLPGLPWWTWL